MTNENARNSLQMALRSTLGNDCAESILRYLDAEGIFQEGSLDADRLEEALRPIIGDGAVPLLRVIMIKKAL